MKGLLVKDLYTIIKQMKIFILMIIILSLLPGISTSSFAVIYAAMLPMTALAYEERSKWNQLAAMMPYSPQDIIMSKYLLGYIMVISAALLSAAAGTAIAALRNTPVSTDFYAQLIVIVCLASIFQAINLPVMFKVGVEKGRLVFILLIAIIVAAGAASGNRITGYLASTNLDIVVLSAGLLIFTLLANLISIIISASIYKNLDL